MADRLQGKTVVVTRASPGIGAGNARDLATKSANVVLADLNKQITGAVVEQFSSTGGGEALAARSGATNALALKGITVEAFAPGVLENPLWTVFDRDLDGMGEVDSTFDSMSEGTLLGRTTAPHGQIPIAVLLVVPGPAYTAGQVIPVDRGMILV